MAARKLRPVTPEDVGSIHTCLTMLRFVRERLRAAGAHKAAQSVRRTLKSVEGAQRHAERAVAARRNDRGPRELGATQ